jgi:vacuolar iron transporter family protein
MAYSIHQKASFLKDIVFSASDGLVTTFAVVAGSVGAELSPRVVVIMGFANLLADGFSMAAGNYVGSKSQMEFEKSKTQRKVANEGSPFTHGLMSFMSFTLIGFIPLIPYVFRITPLFYVSLLFVALSMFGVGAVRSKFTHGNLLKGGLEVLFVGGTASAAAYAIGHLLSVMIL